MGQAKQRQAEIAKLKILSQPRPTNGFDMFWVADANLVDDDGIIDLPGITSAIATWAAHPRGFGFTGRPDVSVEKVEDHPFHKDGVKITLKWDHYVKIDIAEALARLRYVITGPDHDVLKSYSGAEFYVSEKASADMIQALKDLELA